MKLLIAIPALNEEQSIRSIIERCLAAKREITSGSPVREIDVTVVSDGSTDRTADIAREYLGRIHLIAFERNRGYGAAISEAWRQSDADLLGFLDADGTCDPRLFARLCRDLIERDADVVLGCRMHPQSKMPLLRRAGNLFFAWLLTLFSFRRVRDTASGMRVVRRSSLPKLLPLPEGMHFTPAMSARAMLSRDLVIVEAEMPYHERQGRSKLRPVKDGLRFLRVIVETALLYRPSRPLGLVACGLLLFTLAMMAYPTGYYLAHGTVLEWMIYRFLVGEMFCTIAVIIFCLSYLGTKAADIALADDPAANQYHGLGGWLFCRRWIWLVPVGLLICGSLPVLEPLANYLSTGRVTAHWSRFVGMRSLFSAAATIAVTKVVDHGLNLLAGRLAYLKGATAEASKAERDAAQEPQTQRRAA
ncbi:MAG: glycosyltransferase family 2 protein [Planctomycetia bacterium]|nr:glycosyltransferase family 2 protein [Planctomycetia bacterium]